jgi:hypothetical protein
MFSIS